MEAIIIFPLILIVLIIWGVIEQQRPEGTYAEREKNPNLRTNDWEQHQRRLNKFSKSTYKKTTFYVGSRGGVYYISSRGTKVYC